ncbi:type VI secretion system protein TssA [Aliivibrio logei]|uniref:type VI secretion system protein TssA n=1 Tax=Aliivibrio logei TaxID=688 RepID=UPI0035C8E123
MFSYNEILTDISEEDRLGIDFTYEPEFESIENEINKATDLFATSKTDWQVVHVNSLNLISKNSKDYRVLYWMLLSFQHISSSIDYISLLTLINEFIIKYRDNIYPKRAKQQYSSINKIVNVINEETKSITSNMLDIEIIDNLIDILLKLDESIISIFESKTDTLSLLISHVNKHKKRVTSEATPSTIEPIKTPSTQSINTISHSTSISLSHADIANERDANKALRHLQEVTRNLSKYWLNQNIGDEKAYQLSRTLTWVTITQTPSSNDDNITALKPVPQARQQHLIQLKNQANHTALLIDLEESLSKSPFWLDGHFMAWETLSELNYHDAAQSVTDQLSLLIKKAPKITDLKFDDGSEFAKPETQIWIEQHCSQNTSQTQSKPQFTERNTSSEWDLVLKEALPLLKQEPLSDVLQPLIIGHHQSRSAREAFFWQFSQATLLLHANKYELAAPLLRWLDNQYSHSVLTLWDPLLEERLLDLWLTCQSKLPVKKQDTQLIITLRERLCCLNPIRVLND